MFKIGGDMTEKMSSYGKSLEELSKDGADLWDGHGVFRSMGEEIGFLVDKKQEAYGDSYGRSGAVMRELYPNGINLLQMDDALAVVRVVDKLFRIATRKDAFGESPWKDIAGYGLLGCRKDNGLGNERTER
jgi:hypothetical protein